MIRHLFRQVGSVAVASFLWQHRGSVVRTVDLARRLPHLVQDGRVRDALTEAKAIVALDGRIPTRMDVRITGFDDGSMMLRGDLPLDHFEEARATLLAVDEWSTSGPARCSSPPSTTRSHACTDMAAESPRPTGDRPKGLEDAAAEPTVEELRREQRREASHTTYVHTQGQVHGALIGALVFGLVGLGLGAIIGLAMFDAGSAARIRGPGRRHGVRRLGRPRVRRRPRPEVEHETMTIYGEPQDGTSDRPPERDAREP